MFWVIWLISFIVVVMIFKTVINGLMRFIGADWYMFSARTRVLTCGLISLVLAFLIYACING